MRIRFFPENPTQKKIAIWGTFAFGVILATQGLIFKRFQDSIRGLKSLGDEEFNIGLKALESSIKPDLAEIISHVRQDVKPWSDNQIMLAFFLMLLVVYFGQIQIMSNLGIGERPVENARPPRESETDSDTHLHPE